MTTLIHNSQELLEEKRKSILNHRLITKSQNERILFCIAWEFTKHGRTSTGFEYTHADSAGEARAIFLGGLKYQDARRTLIVGIAPVIGFFSKDEHGDRLTV